MKNVLETVGFSAALFGVIFAYVVLVSNLPFNLWELLALLGVGLVMGTLMGQNKCRKTPVKEYLPGRTKSFITLFVLLFAIIFAYQIRNDHQIDGWTVLGIMVITAAGWIARFHCGRGQGQGPRGRKVINV